MSGVDRWEVTRNDDGLGFSNGIRPSEDGNYVSYEDYLALSARIAELEAKLATALDALEKLTYLQSGGPCTGARAGQWVSEARAAIALIEKETK